MTKWWESTTTKRRVYFYYTVENNGLDTTVAREIYPKTHYSASDVSQW